MNKRRAEKKEAFTRRKTLRKRSIMALGASPSLDEISQMSQVNIQTEEGKEEQITKAEIQYHVRGM